MTEGAAPAPVGPRPLNLDLDALAAAVFAHIDAGDVAGKDLEDLPDPLEPLRPLEGPLYLSLRADGVRLAHGWGEADASLAATLAPLIEAIPEARRGDIDGVELNLTHDWGPVDLGDADALRAFVSNFVRGVRGFELIHQGTSLRVAPTQAIAQNRNYGKWLDIYRQERKLTQADLARDVTARWFNADQVLLTRPPEAPTPIGRPLFRGNTLIEQTAVDRAFVETLERDLGDYLVRALHPNGRMTYLFYPSQGREDQKRNNMIRQWMATVALGRTAAYREEKQIHRLGEENIRHNLRSFYHATGKLGCIEFNGKVKLGAVALAVISILEHPKRKQFKRIEERLWNMIDHLWQDDGGFRTFFKPSDRNDVQNFYPGEAQLAWAFRYGETRDARLLEKFMASMRYYQDWHRAQRNPAFVPWHVQAYYHVWKINGDDALRDWVFEMSDWLLNMAQTRDNIEHLDELGRFYDPKNPRFGPPHASATGVYLEGLIDAFELAREVGDEARTERYRLAIVRGLRSVRQVMLKDDADMFYIRAEQRALLRGSVRNAVYDNVMRIDNVQHNQMGIIKILRAFHDDDFRETRA